MSTIGVDDLIVCFFYYLMIKMIKYKKLPIGRTKFTPNKWILAAGSPKSALNYRILAAAGPKSALNFLMLWHGHISSSRV